MGGSQSKLQREIRQNRPFHSASQEAFLAILKTADVLRRHFARIVEPHGLTPQQYNVLRIVRGAGAGGIPTLAISERLIEETPGMTRLLDRLEEKKLVRRKRCPEDRRQVLCWLTEKGAGLLDLLDKEVAASDRLIAEALSHDETGALIAFLDKIRAGAAT